MLPRTTVAVIGVLGMLLCGRALLGQEQERSQTHPPGPNPHLGVQASIRSGMVLYRVRCGDCHGLDARGYRGPDLTSVLPAVSDAQLFQIIRKGVANTEMPPSRAQDDELLLVIAYLRSLGAVTDDGPAGNVANGQRLFGTQCARCHRVGATGGRLGPELSRIGITRSRAAMIREIRTPSEWVPPGYETVTVVAKDGSKIRGVKKNEDPFSIQVMDVRERLQGFLRSDLRDVTYESDSLMPTYGPDRLSDSDLNDIVGYLKTLREPPPAKPGQ